jgi:hypothetical protein
MGHSFPVKRHALEWVGWALVAAAMAFYLHYFRPWITVTYLEGKTIVSVIVPAHFLGIVLARWGRVRPWARPESEKVPTPPEAATYVLDVLSSGLAIFVTVLAWFALDESLTPLRGGSAEIRRVDAVIGYGMLSVAALGWAWRGGGPRPWLSLTLRTATWAGLYAYVYIRVFGWIPPAP